MIEFDDDYIEEVVEYQRRIDECGWGPLCRLELLTIPPEHRRTKESVVLPNGWIWDEDWHVVIGSHTDEDGWQYCISIMIDRWSNAGTSQNFVRRRWWARTRVSLSNLIPEDKIDNQSNEVHMVWLHSQPALTSSFLDTYFFGEGIDDEDDSMSDVSSIRPLEVNATPKPRRRYIRGKSHMLKRKLKLFKGMVTREGPWRMFVIRHYSAWDPQTRQYNSEVMANFRELADIELDFCHIHTHLHTLSRTDGCPIRKVLLAFGLELESRDKQISQVDDIIVQQTKADIYDFNDALVQCILEDKEMMEFRQYPDLLLRCVTEISEYFLYHLIFRLYNRLCTGEDSALLLTVSNEENTILLKSHIPEECRQMDCTSATQCIRRIADKRTCCSKLDCIVTAMRQLAKQTSAETQATQDVLTPLVVWCVYRSNLPNMWSESVLMADFVDETQTLGPRGVALSTFQLAAAFLLQLSKQKVLN